MSIDLHLHSSASDGSLSPAELIALGKEAGLTAMALTDHDTVSGCGDFSSAAQDAGIKVVSGVEISCVLEDDAMHLLGYGFDVKNPGLIDMLAQLRAGRSVRNAEILAKLAALGCPLSAQRLSELAGGESVGRPHVAQALIEAGHVASFREAFTSYLAKGCPAYVERWRPNMGQAIKVLHDAGGCAVLAHPHALTEDPAELRSWVQKLSELGLDGLESLYTRYNQTKQKALLSMAGDFGLISTGGSDFHGACTPDIRLGAREIPDSVFDGLCASLV